MCVCLWKGKLIGFLSNWGDPNKSISTYGRILTTSMLILEKISVLKKVVKLDYNKAGNYIKYLHVFIKCLDRINLSTLHACAYVHVVYMAFI